MFFIGVDQPLRYRVLDATTAAPLFAPDDVIPAHVIVAPIGDWAAVDFNHLLGASDAHDVTVVPAGRTLADDPDDA